MAIIIPAMIVLVTAFHCQKAPSKEQVQSKHKESMKSTKLDTATFAAGCFWCVEAVFQNAKGVESIVSGYAGGHVANPTYKQVCDGTTGHAEACQIMYDPDEISYAELLEIFWKTH